MLTNEQIKVFGGCIAHAAPSYDPRGFNNRGRKLSEPSEWKGMEVINGFSSVLLIHL